MKTRNGKLFCGKIFNKTKLQQYCNKFKKLHPIGTEINNNSFPEYFRLFLLIVKNHPLYTIYHKNQYEEIESFIIHEASLTNKTRNFHIKLKNGQEYPISLPECIDFCFNPTIITYQKYYKNLFLETCRCEIHYQILEYLQERRDCGYEQNEMMQSELSPFNWFPKKYLHVHHSEISFNEIVKTFCNQNPDININQIGKEGIEDSIITGGHWWAY
jgi:hypothetical protein